MSCVGSAAFRPKLKNNKLTKRDKAHELYPFETSSVNPEQTILVLGPEVYATQDGSVINWRGVAYVRQVPLTSAQLDPLEIKSDPRPHSRACGVARHEHGGDCSTNCPSCGGK